MLTEVHYQELDAMLKKAVEQDDRLTEWERDFVSDFVDKLEEYGERIRVSPKQQEILDRIERKLE